MKTVKDKMVGQGEASNKLPSRLVCHVECVIIDVGSFDPGQVITDPETIKKVVGSPCFSPAEGE